ncbi:hypothetical protein SRIMM317S_04870 [Streptomyces rimosus subsp. rimosus]
MFAGQGSGIMLATYDDPGNSTAAQRLRPGTLRRILSYAKPHSRESVLLLVLTLLDSLIIVSTPLLLKEIVDVGILQKDTSTLTVGVSLVVAGLAVLDALLPARPELVLRAGSARASATTCGSRRSRTYSASRWPSSPVPRPGPW